MERQKKRNLWICAAVALSAIATIMFIRTVIAQDKPPVRSEPVRRTVRPVQQPKLIESNQGRNGLNANGGITINGNNNHIHVGDVITQVTHPVERVIIREVIRETPRTEETTPAKIVSVSVTHIETKRNPECDVRYREYEQRNQQWNALFR